MLLTPGFLSKRLLFVDEEPELKISLLEARGATLDQLRGQQLKEFNRVGGRSVVMTFIVPYLRDIRCLSYRAFVNNHRYTSI